MRSECLLLTVMALASPVRAQKPEFEWLQGFASGYETSSSSAQVQYLSDGGSFVTDSFGEAMVFQIPGALPVRSIDLGGGRFDGVSPDRSRLVAHLQSGVIRDYRNGAFIRNFGNIPEQFYIVRMSPNARFVAVYSPINNLLQIYDLATFEVKSIRKSWMPSGPFTFTPDGEKLAGGTFNGQTAVIRPSGEYLFMVEGQVSAFSPDGARLFVQPGNGIVAVYNGDTGARLGEIPTFWSSGRPFVSRDGQAILGTAVDGYLELWDIPTGLLKWRSQVPVHQTSGCDFSPDGTEVLVSGPYPALTRRFSIADGPLLSTIPATPQSGAKDSAVSGDGRLGFRQGRNGVQVWSTGDGILLKEFVGPGDPLVANDDGSLLASRGVGGSVALYDSLTGNLMGNLYGHPDGPRQLEFSKDRQFIYSRDFSNLVKWNLVTGAVEYELTGFTNLRAMDLSNDGALLAAAHSNGTVDVVRAEDGHLLYALSSSGTVQSLSFSPDNSLIVVTHGNTVEALDLASRTSLWIVSNPRAYGVSFMTPTVFVVWPDLANIGNPVTNTFRNAATGEVVAQFDQMATQVRRLNDDEIFLAKGSFVGKAWNPVTVPKAAPSSCRVVFGQSLGGSVDSLGSHDDDALLVRTFIVPNQQVAPVTVDVYATSPTASPRRLQFKTLARSLGGNALSQKVELFNWSTNAFDAVDVGNSGVSNDWSFSAVDGSGDLSRYVRAGDRAMRARYSLRPQGVQATSAITVKHDLAVWYVGR